MRIDSVEASERRRYQSLERVEEQRQGFTQSPSDNNQNWNDEERDLNARSDGDAHRQIKFTLPGNHDRGGVFCGVGDDGNDNKGDPFLVDRRMLNETVDALDETLGGKVGEYCDEDQKEQGGRGVHAGIFNMVQGSSTGVGLDG